MKITIPPGKGLKLLFLTAQETLKEYAARNYPWRRWDFFFFRASFSVSRRESGDTDFKQEDEGRLAEKRRGLINTNMRQLV